MTVKERFAKFDADFERLKRNREQVPLEKLQTTYAEPYNAMVAEITAYADWYAEQYLGTLLPTSPGTRKTPPGTNGSTRGSPPSFSRKPGPEGWWKSGEPP